MKLFREHKAFLDDSLATTVEVNGLNDIVKLVEEKMPYVSNVKIRADVIPDKRLPPEWNGICYLVVGDLEGYQEQCIGMSNFFE